MSVQSARDFIKQLESDRTLQDRLQAAADDEARRQIIQAAGFDFTREEFHQAVAEISAAAGQEMSAEELDGIAAGTGRAGWCGIHAKPCKEHIPLS
jgi:predicted ribosomally synthesized peptide with nif11-like leader